MKAIMTVQDVHGRPWLSNTKLVGHKCQEKRKKRGKKKKRVKIRVK